MPDEYEDCETNLGGTREADIPLGVVRAGVEVAVEALADRGLEEEEVVVDEEEGNGPALQEAVEVGRRDEGEPGDGGGDDGDLLDQAGAAEGVAAE